MKKPENMPVLVRAALTCVACDTPAARKVCGFMGHSALKGFLKCLKSFETESFGMKADYSVFNRRNLTPRSTAEHRCHAVKHKACNTLAEQIKIEREHRCR